MTCDHCGNVVPDGVFCTRCGSHHGTTADAGDPQTRHQHYAAAPGEHVAQPSVFSTILPHLGHTKVHEFRWAFLIGLALIIGLTAGGFVSGALVAAICLIPLLYLLYLYEANVYRDEPLPVLALTIGGGILLGTAFGVVTQLVLRERVNVSPGSVLIFDVLLPVIMLVLMPLPALLLRRPPFEQTIDGLVFGIASGLGFSAALLVVRYSDVFGTIGVRDSAPSSWIYTVIGTAVFVPLLLGSSSGALSAALWRTHRGPHAARWAVLSFPVIIVAFVGFFVVSDLLANVGVNPLIVLAWEAVPVGAVLIYVRYLLHHALLDEAADLGFTATVCPRCHRHVIAAAFCPACGVALEAAPRAVAQREPAGAAAAASPEGF